MNSEIPNFSLIRAAYFAVIAIHQTPSRRTVGDMVKRITGGKGVRHQEVLLFLRQFRGPLGDQAKTESGPPPGPSTPNDRDTLGTTTGTNSGPQQDPTRAPHKVLYSKETISMREPSGSLSGEDAPRAEEKPTTRVRPEIPSVAFEAQDEHRVSLLLAVMAGQNKTGTLAATRVAGERAKLRALLDQHGTEAWRYACDDVAARSGIRDPVPYAAGIMRGYDPTARSRKPTTTASAPPKVSYLQNFANARPMHEVLGVEEGQEGTWDTVAARFAGKDRLAPLSSLLKSLPETS